MAAALPGSVSDPDSCLTTISPPTGAVLHDEDLAHAIVDRILERGRILRLDGPSMRTRHLGLDDFAGEAVSTQMGGISGIERAEFPEPTTGNSQLPSSVLEKTRVRTTGLEVQQT